MSWQFYFTVCTSVMCVPRHWTTSQNDDVSFGHDTRVKLLLTSASNFSLLSRLMNTEACIIGLVKWTSTTYSVTVSSLHTHTFNTLRKQPLGHLRHLYRLYRPNKLYNRSELAGFNHSGRELAPNERPILDGFWLSSLIEKFGYNSSLLLTATHQLKSNPLDGAGRRCVCGCGSGCYLCPLDAV